MAAPIPARCPLALARFCARERSFCPTFSRAGLKLNLEKFSLSRRTHSTCSASATDTPASAGASRPDLKHFISKARNAESVVGNDSREPVPYLSKADVWGNGRKVYIETYGCQMNVNDTEIALSILKESGYEKTDEVQQADVALLMTCAIREGAENKIWSRIDDLKRLKRRRAQTAAGAEPMKIGILGCMAERLKQRIVEREKAVDLVCGPDAYKDLPRLLAVTDSGQTAVNVLLSHDETYADVIPVRLDKSAKSAFVSIMRGCDNMCSYCIVPFTRGRERSRPMESIIDEVRVLSAQGVKELTLLGQNVNSYRDMSESEISSQPVSSTSASLSKGFSTVYKPRHGGTRFADLLEKVSDVDPEMRVRFTSPHPKDFPDEVLQLIRDRPNICKQLHMPAQSGSTAVLASMRRGYTREAYLELVQRVRDIVPDVSLSSDFISGFCGESEQDHEDTLSLLRAVKYNYVYNFMYSMREKTHAYHRLTDDVPEELKRRRADEVTALFRDLAKEINRSQIGQSQLVLVEGVSKRSPNEVSARNDGGTKVIVASVDAPIRSDCCERAPMRPGDYIAVRISDATSQVLKGVALHRSSVRDFGSDREAEHAAAAARATVSAAAAASSLY